MQSTGVCHVFDGLRGWRGGWRVVLLSLFCLVQSAAMSTAGPSFTEIGGQPVQGAERDAVLAQLRLDVEHGIDVDRLRVVRFPVMWLDSATLYQIGGGWHPPSTKLYLLHDARGRYHRLEGDPRQLYSVIQQQNMDLRSETVAEFLRFAGFFSQVGGVAMVILDHPKDRLAWDLNAKTLPGKWQGKAEGLSPSSLVRRLVCSGPKGPGFICNGTARRADKLFEAKFEVRFNGRVTVLASKVVAEGLPELTTTEIVLDRAAWTRTPVPPAAQQEVADAVAPTSRLRPRDSLQSLTGRIDTDLLATLQALMDDRPVKLNGNNQPFLAGLAMGMMEKCGLPKSVAARTKLGLFATSSSMGAMMGMDYSNPDIGAAIGSAWTQQSLLTSGAVAASTLGCGEALDELGERLAKLISANSAAGSRFVDGCASSFDKPRCTCIANVGRQVIPDIAEMAYDRQVLTNIIERNPLVGLTLALTCGISNY